MLGGVSVTDKYRVFTSESVTEGHPDKLCDQVSDAILDAVLSEDPHARVAVETLTTTGLVHVVGELSTTAYVEIPDIVRGEIRRIGYTSSEASFDADSCGVSVSIDQQSGEIAQGVDKSVENRLGTTDRYASQGAGDQGLMFGYASADTPTLMPLPIYLAHRLTERLAKVRRENIVENLLPDGKSQVSISYDGDQPVSLDTVVLSNQHRPAVSQAELLESFNTHVLTPVLAAEELDLDTGNFQLLVNPTGSFIIGGPRGDAGLTGRKLMVDTYGGMARHGGGAFSGKDPSKVDRSAAYAMRWVAKNVVAAGLASRCEVQVAYAIGKATPVGLYAETFGTGQVPDDELVRAINKAFDLRPAAIIDELDLLRPIYRQTAAYGHFGRELPEFTWERTDRIAELQNAL